MLKSLRSACGTKCQNLHDALAVADLVKLYDAPTEKHSTMRLRFAPSIAALIKLTNFRAKDNEWQHGQVQAELNRQLIMRKKLLPAELGRTPMDLMELRHLADYKPQSVAAREAKRAYDRAERFLSSIGRALGETV